MRVSGKANGIRLATINIRSWREVGLEAALRDLNQGNLYLGILQETKLKDGIHVHCGAGYVVWATVADRRYRVGIVVV